MRALLLSAVLLLGCGSSGVPRGGATSVAESPELAKNALVQAVLADWDAGRPHLFSLPERVYRCEPPVRNFYEELSLSCNQFSLEFSSKKRLLEALEEGELAQELARLEMNEMANHFLPLPRLEDEAQRAPDRLPGLSWESRRFSLEEWRFFPSFLYKEGLLTVESTHGRGEVRVLPGGSFLLTTDTPPLVPQEVIVPTVQTAVAQLQARAIDAYWEQLRAREEADFRADFVSLRAKIARWKSTGMLGEVKMGWVPPRTITLLPRFEQGASAYDKYAPFSRRSLLESIEDADEPNLPPFLPGKYDVFRFFPEGSDESLLIALRDGKVISVGDVSLLKTPPPPERLGELFESLAAELASDLGMSTRFEASKTRHFCEMEGDDAQIRVAVERGRILLRLSIARGETLALKEKVRTLVSARLSAAGEARWSGRRARRDRPRQWPLLPC